MKKLTILLIAILVMIILIGCQRGSYEHGDVENGQYTVDNMGLLGATRHYDVQSFRLDIDIDFWQFYFFLHQEQLNLFLLEECDDTLNSYVHLLVMDADGANLREVYRTVLDENIDYFRIIGVEKHDDGYISLVSTDHVILPPYTREDFFDGLWGFEVEYKYIYRSISPDGEVVSEIEIEALNNDERQITISDIAFDVDGNAVASATWLPADFDLSATGGMIPEGVGGQSFFLFNNGLTGDFHEVTDTRFSPALFNRMNDGQVIAPSFAWSHETDVVMFYEIDFENIAVIDGPVIEREIPIDSISGVFSAPEASEFDLYFIGNERELFGYRKLDGTFTSLIDFLQLGVSINHWGIDRHSFLLWDDGQITIVDIGWDASLGREEINLFLLTPSDEPLSSMSMEREIIVLGGVDVNFSPLIDQVAVFNRQSGTHRIEVINYTHDDMDRLRAELIAGRGPDMFALSWFEVDFVTALAEGQFMLDLYSMIDADPEITREDFFSTVLSTWENSRGELVQIAPEFSILTILGMQSAFPEAPENWNYADFVAFYQDARAAGYDYPLGQIDRLLILEKLLFADDTFFCEDEAVANFDSESFINVLNFAMTIPEYQGWDSVSHLAMEGLWDPVGNLLRGEQLLLPLENIFGPFSFRALQTRLGGITAFGFPSNDAPTHAVQVVFGTSIGIRSNSPHIDAAWEFVRLSLLSDASHSRNSFPLRIDLFEQLIYDELNRTEPTELFLVSGNIELPPMTETDVDFLRELVSNIGHKLVGEHPVQNIVNEDVQAFFAGIRSAEDTARIIQSRVSILLAERERR